MEKFLNVTIVVLTQIFMLVGMFGLIVPIYPGLIIMWLASLGYGVVTGFNTPAIVIFVLLTLLMLVGTLIDNVLLGAGARQGGASWLSIGVSLVAGIVGTIIFPPFGGIIAMPVVILLMEYGRVQDWKKAWLALRGLATGFGLSYVIRLGLGILMMVLWWIWVWKG
jgi:uncharacterized protein YqgC (DUF456 family)